MVASTVDVVALQAFRVPRDGIVQVANGVVRLQPTGVQLHAYLDQQRVDRCKERSLIGDVRPPESGRTAPGVFQRRSCRLHHSESAGIPVLLVFPVHHGTNAMGRLKRQRHEGHPTSRHACWRHAPRIAGNAETRESHNHDPRSTMRTVHFTITASHRSRYGNITIAKLRSIGLPKQERRFTAELADQLEAAGYDRLNEAPTDWGWTIVVPDTAEMPSADRRRVWRGWSPTLLRNARDAKRANWPDEYAAKIFDLGEALERDGFQRIDDAPAAWVWVPGGRS